MLKNIFMENKKNYNKNINVIFFFVHNYTSSCGIPCGAIYPLSTNILVIKSSFIFTHII